MPTHLRIERRDRKSCWITLARAEKHNAIDDVVIAELIEALVAADVDQTVASVVLAADGANFSAGADLSWMRKAASHSREENIADAGELARLMRTLDSLDKTTIAIVQGAAYGGALGLIACCDIAIAASDSRFSLSEVRLGLIPAVISPYVVAAIGARQARRYFQTAETFDAATAKAIGLVHEICPADRLVATAEEILKSLAAAAPGAKSAARKLVRMVDSGESSDLIQQRTIAAIADTRAGEEAKEGLAAFFEKRKPAWQ